MIVDIEGAFLRLPVFQVRVEPHAQEPSDLDPKAGFFEHFSLRSTHRVFTRLTKASRYVPHALPRIMRSPN
jgi:hypothetical protein